MRISLLIYVKLLAANWSLHSVKMSLTRQGGFVSSFCTCQTWSPFGVPAPITHAEGWKPSQGFATLCIFKKWNKCALRQPWAALVPSKEVTSHTCLIPSLLGNGTALRDHGCYILGHDSLCLFGCMKSKMVSCSVACSAASGCSGKCLE